MPDENVLRESSVPSAASFKKTMSSSIAALTAGVRSSTVPATVMLPSGAEKSASTLPPLLPPKVICISGATQVLPGAGVVPGSLEQAGKRSTPPRSAAVVTWRILGA